jgi:hypothetical protein
MTEESALKLALELLSTGGSPTNLAVVALIVAVYVARKLLVKRIPWLASDRAGVATTLALAILGSVATALVGGGTMGLTLVWGAGLAALKAAGGWSLLTKLIWPAEGKPAVSPSLRPTVFVPSATKGGTLQAVDEEMPIRDRR